MVKKIILSLLFIFLLGISFVGGILCVRSCPYWFEAWNYRQNYLLQQIFSFNKGNILFTLSRLNTRGDVMMALRLAKILQREGYRVSLFYQEDDTMKDVFE